LKPVSVSKGYTKSARAGRKKRDRWSQKGAAGGSRPAPYSGVFWPSAGGATKGASFGAPKQLPWRLFPFWSLRVPPRLGAQGARVVAVRPLGALSISLQASHKLEAKLIPTFVFNEKTTPTNYNR
jgi:hypothetical protein